ncbi:TSUP family transporter [Bradyrhizobium sp. NP1]|uniref:TSUP family transporter n=1 Tax=Bradyrhizobium sp. NP1 TaxID=3049772 RepID=UPI0025A4F865|nr:TSUP family transporter [Bradyrhizobium sp. NP1]WJR76849.1 TSUP family transporter [Bradyrhizobium sp. NP1]
MYLELLVLFVVALCAGIVDAIAGGGGLITLPALLLTGMPPAQALATNKIQALASVASSAYRYFRSGEADTTGLAGRLVASVAGASAGAYCLRIADPSLLSRVAPFLLIGVACFFLLSRNHVSTKRPPVLGSAAFAALAVLPIGFYDGFFGPGTGSMYAAAFVLLLGRDLRSATADTKILNTAGSVVAALIFLPGGLIAWPAALAMALGGIIGAQIGAGLALRWGAPLIRRVLVTISIVLALRLLVQQYIA